MAALRRDENIASHERINESMSSQRRSSACASPYSCKVPVCSSASSEEGEDEDKENKRERRRNRVKEEILATEETYQRHLNLIVKFFEQPLRDNGLLPPHVIVTIFSNLHQIIAINTELSGHLRSLSIGRAFLHMAPFLKLYSTYANNHERGLATLMEWEQKCPELSVFRRSQEEEEEMGGLKLNALLITPVQRIPRYKLLLQELLQFTPKDDEDYKNIQDASLHIGEVAQHINEHIKQQDNFNKMLAIQKSLAGPVAPQILTPGRIFIKDGRLKKVSKKHGRSLERMFFLFSDILMYAKPHLLEHHAHYVCCCIMPLQHCMVARVFGNSSSTKSQGALFTITCKTESLLLYSDQKTVDSWISTLTKAIGQLVKNRQSLRKESSAKAPLRKAALAKLHKMKKMEDPLQAAMRKNSPQNSANKAMKKNSAPSSLRSLSTGDSSSHVGCLSPRKRLGNMDFPRLDIGCLSPRSRLRKKKKKLQAGDDDSVYESSESVATTHVPLTPTEAPRRSLSVGPRTRSMSWASTKVSSPKVVSPLPLLLTDSPLAQEDIKEGAEHEIQRFIPEGEDEDDEEELTNSDSEMSLTESDLLSLFTAADAMDSGLQSHLHSYSDSSCSQSLSNIPECSVPPSPVPPSPVPSTSSADPYDYNNYAPGFANKYRTPVRMSRQDSVDSVFVESNSPVKKRRSYVTATQAVDQADGVFEEEQETKEAKETEADSESISSKRSSRGALKSLKDQLPSLDKVADVAVSALDAATTITQSAPACSLQ